MRTFGRSVVPDMKDPGCDHIPMAMRERPFFPSHEEGFNDKYHRKDRIAYKKRQVGSLK